MTQLLPLTESEAIFAPFHDPFLSSEIPFQFHPLAARQADFVNQWDTLAITWAATVAREPAVELILPIDFDLSPYDTFIFSLTATPEIQILFSVGDGDGHWTPLGKVVPGEVGRMEIARPVPKIPPKNLRVTFFGKTGDPGNIKLIWFAVRNQALFEAIQKQRVIWQPDWAGLIRPEKEWKALENFPHGLLGDASILGPLREKKEAPHWREHFQRLERAARDAMKTAPEKFLAVSDYAPFTDFRYSRLAERTESSLHYDGLRLALVGLVNQDHAMIRHAARYLMTMLHLKSWSVSAECRLQGSTWDQRCFVEEMMSTSCALLLDWLDGVLTDRARELAQTKLWDLGLAVIERDMPKFPYMHSINQGAWFCRGRIFGGMVLEKVWPIFGRDYVDKAAHDLRAIMDRYLQPDGGMDEGPMYLLLTLETILPPLIAYAKRRGQNIHHLLPRALPLVENYLGALAQAAPGLHIPNGDCGSEYPDSDTYPILASLFPDSGHRQVAAASLLSDRPFTYQQHYVGTGIFSFLLGPPHLEDPASLQATFRMLPETGIVSSHRQKNGTSLSLVLFGSKAHPSHAHFDRGSFTAEWDGIPLLVDRGTIRYDDQRSFLLKRSDCHNVLVASFDGVATEEQSMTPVPITPEAQGDETRFEAGLDLASVWPGIMRSYRREIRSENTDAFSVEDTGELVRDGQVVFLLQSRFPFTPSEAGVWNSGPLRVFAPWAKDGDSEEYLFDSQFRPIFRLRLWSDSLRQFSLQTDFKRCRPS